MSEIINELPPIYGLMYCHCSHCHIKFQETCRKNSILSSYLILSCVHVCIYFCSYSKIGSNLVLSRTWQSMIEMYTHDIPSNFQVLKFQENGVKSPIKVIHICESLLMPLSCRRKGNFVDTCQSLILGKNQPLSWKNVKILCIYLCTHWQRLYKVEKI